MMNSLQMRLAVGAALMATIALMGAALVIVSGQVTRASLGTATDVERRIDLMTALAAQISDYGLLSLEAARQAGPTPALAARLEAEGRQVEAQLDKLDAAYAAAVTAEHGFDERTRTATRGMGAAQMRSAFERLRASVEADPRSGVRTNELELFAADFSPALNATIADEYRIRAAALDRIEALLQQGRVAAVAIGVAALGLFAVFVVWVVRPMFRRLDVLLSASRRMAAGDLAVALPEGARDEFAPLYDATSRLARRLADESERVAADRARLNEIVAERTAQLSAANTRLAEIDADRRRFFADISHELRTPLTVILMETDLAAQGGDAGASLGVIRSRARRLTQRVDDMLRVARSTSGRIELEPAPLDLAALAAAAVSDVRRQAARAGVEVEAAATAPVPVVGDPNWTRQVVEGLVDNAVRHAGSGGRLRVAASRAAAGPQLQVIDNGPGLGGDPEGLFRRFERGEARARGFGVGLALARWIIEEQGGRIMVESPVTGPDRLGDAPGTRVTVTLPEEAESREAAP